MKPSSAQVRLDFAHRPGRRAPSLLVLQRRLPGSRPRTASAGSCAWRAHALRLGISGKASPGSAGDARRTPSAPRPNSRRARDQRLGKTLGAGARRRGASHRAPRRSSSPARMSSSTRTARKEAGRLRAAKAHRVLPVTTTASAPACARGGRRSSGVARRVSGAASLRDPAPSPSTVRATTRARAMARAGNRRRGARGPSETEPPSYSSRRRRRRGRPSARIGAGKPGTSGEPSMESGRRWSTLPTR